MNPRGDAGRSTHRRQKCKLAARRRRFIHFTRRRLCGDSRAAASARVDIHFLRERCVIDRCVSRNDALSERDAITTSPPVRVDRRTRAIAAPKMRESTCGANRASRTSLHFCRRRPHLGRRKRARIPSIHPWDATANPKPNPNAKRIVINHPLTSAVGRRRRRRRHRRRQKCNWT